MDHFMQVYDTDQLDPNEEEMMNTADDNFPQPTEITESDTFNVIRSLKNRKAPGIDQITNEPLKYEGEHLIQELTKLVKIMFQRGQVPKEWKTSITVTNFKRGDGKMPSNYRGITLLSAALKVLTKIIIFKLEPFTRVSEEQGFRKNRSTIDALFILRQLIEKSIEFSKPAFMCFIDLAKAFDRVRLKDVLTILKRKEAPSDLVALIEDINTQTITQIRTDEGLSDPVRTPTGVQQGDSLSPALLSLIMDEIISKVRSLNGYKMGTGKINITCYADDAALVAESEDDLQRLLHQFNISAKKMNHFYFETFCVDYFSLK